MRNHYMLVEFMSTNQIIQKKLAALHFDISKRKKNFQPKIPFLY